jgi:hypothetical protein
MILRAVGEAGELGALYAFSNVCREELGFASRCVFAAGRAAWRKEARPERPGAPPLPARVYMRSGACSDAMAFCRLSPWRSFAASLSCRRFSIWICR